MTSGAGDGSPWRLLTADAIGDLRYNDLGLVTVVTQDASTGHVLMVAYANQEALRLALETGRMTYFSRSRNQLWVKGEESGHAQELVSLAYDCDADAVLATVHQTGPACHTHATTCFLPDGATPSSTVAGMLGTLEALARARQAQPMGYTGSLLTNAQLVSAKIEEEAGEVGRVLRGEDNEDTAEHEAADLLYHLVVGLRAHGVNLADVMQELQRRHR